MVDGGGSARALRAINHNSLHSLRFHARRGGLFLGEAAANMAEFDRRCRKIVEIEAAENRQNLQNQQVQEMWVIPYSGSE